MFQVGQSRGVNFPLCRHPHTSLAEVYDFWYRIFTVAKVVMLLGVCCSYVGYKNWPLLFSNVFSPCWRAKASHSVYPEDYILLHSWKQKKDLATPIICSLLLTIKTWRNKYPNHRVVHRVFSSNQQVPSSNKLPPFHPRPQCPNTENGLLS